ncbi:MAG: ribonuclease J [Patescibacteria group bacterium]|nr:ribonuclease J [Patescibacteria group bacterium]
MIEKNNPGKPRKGKPKKRRVVITPRNSSQNRRRKATGPKPKKPGVGSRQRFTKRQHKAPANTPRLRIYALGGLEEIGRNCTVFECGNDIVIIDIGMMFPEEGMPGIDYIIPNISSLRGKEKNIRGVIITHGHMDHIGGIPLTIGRLGYPTIHTAPLTAGIIKKRQEEFGNVSKLKIQNVTDETRVQLGKHFRFEPFHVNHSIADAFGVALHTPYGTILYTGDFKFDYTPIDEDPVNLAHVASFGLNGTLMLMSDSTGATSPGHQISESQVGREVERIIREHKGRLYVATFSSLLTRVGLIINTAAKYGRKVMIEGRSMKNNIEIAQQLGYMKFPPGTIVSPEQFKQMPPDKGMIVCTGAQGERNAVLMRVANGEHKNLRFGKGDGIIFSSSVVPGNERTVQRLKDTLVKQGTKVYHYNDLDVHVSGHAKQEELKLMMRLTMPKYLMPIHGNRFMLEAHAELGREAGIAEDNILVAENGQVVEFDNRGGQLSREKVTTDYVMVDGLGVGDVSQVVLRDRIQLADEGMFIVIATVDRKTGALMSSPDIISRGFVYMRESKELVERARSKVKKILQDTDPKSPAFEDHLKNKIRNEVGSLLFHETKRRPMILPVIIEV